MSSYFITGKQGNGKGLAAVARIFDYLDRGCRVATNIDIKLEGYYGSTSKKTVTRVPDKPTVEHFKQLGSANLTYDEDKNGLLVLDELAAWFNTRSWQDKSRKEVLEYFIYLRKLGWDVLLIVQDIDSVDGQLRGMLAEHLVVCKRLDRIKIPVLGNLSKLFFSKPLTLPKVHRAKVYFGETEQDMHVDTWTYSGKQFYNCYDTKQIFRQDDSQVVHDLVPLCDRPQPAPLPTLRERLADAWDEYCYPVRPAVSTQKHPLIERIMKLPDEQQRIEFLKRFDACGAFR